ncbi:PREDICTED: uncharacterized protein LOC105563235 [Vollenhovia emeryi]|uniref:uncharacterized protein LOC105563235 n=1 Tax=Vollenhovia emeryi TaxID=411798 RepID=UPI0005F4FD63|nr:PREDICTED: uncharacterized protein LOC105563235 [Vollenhovia emeryi]
MGETRVCAKVYVYATFAIIAVVLINRVTSCAGPLKYYEDLGCTPVYRKGEENPCAIRYNCNHMYRRFPHKCYINGREHGIDEFLKPIDANVCDNMCTCKYPREYPTEIAAFECIDIKSLCPKKRVIRGCYLIHDPSKCCGDPKEICPETPEDRGICIVDGQEYEYGDYFRVKADPRLTCVCKPGYEGKNVPPFCHRANHSVCDHPAFSHEPYFYRKCAPVFTSEQINPDRCFVRVKCQKAFDKVVRINFNPLDEEWYDERNVCQFGNLRMQIGDSLEQLDSDCVKCTCEVPPVPTCKMWSDSRHCYSKNNFPQE